MQSPDVSRRPPSPLAVHARSLAPAALLAVAYLAVLHALNLRLLMIDPCMIFAQAQALAFDGVWPLAGNPMAGNLHLGPFADILTAVPFALIGRVGAVYYFVWLLFLVSLPVFYAAMRRVGEPAAAMWCTLWLAVGVISRHLMTIPWNTSYLPLFLALCALALTVEPRRAGWLPFYALAGLSAQLHITMLLLVPGAIIHLWPGRRRFVAEAPWHLAGVAIILALHATTFLYHWQMGGATNQTAAALAERAASFNFGRAAGAALGGAAMLWPLWPLWLARWRAVRRGGGRPWSGAERKTIVALAAQIALLAVVEGVHRVGALHYWLCLWPLACIALAREIDAAPKWLSGRARDWRVGAAMAVFLALFLWEGWAIWRHDYFALSDYRLIVERLRPWLAEHGAVAPNDLPLTLYRTDRDLIHPAGSDDYCLPVLARFADRAFRAGGRGPIVDVFALAERPPGRMWSGEAYRRTALTIPSTCDGPFTLDDMRVYFCPRASGDPVSMSEHAGLLFGRAAPGRP